jgi:predicted RNA-binding protein with TRAM domain
MRYDKGYVDFTRPPPPVKEGDVLSVKIEGMGSSGDGLARVKGFVVFIPDTKVDEEVKVRITKVSRKVGFAERVDDDTEVTVSDDADEATESTD